MPGVSRGLSRSGRLAGPNFPDRRLALLWPPVSRLCANLTVDCRIESSIRRTLSIIFAGCPCATNGILSILSTNSWRTSRQSKRGTASL